MLLVPEAEIHYAWSHIIELEEKTFSMNILAMSCKFAILTNQQIGERLQHASRT